MILHQLTNTFLIFVSTSLQASVHQTKLEKIQPSYSKSKSQTIDFLTENDSSKKAEKEWINVMNSSSRSGNR